MTVACMSLLHASKVDVWPWWPPVGSVVAEAFPAAQLLHWKLPHQKYNGNDESARSNRGVILEALERRIAVSDAYRDVLLGNADALDAVLCGLAAVGVSTGQLESEPPPAANVEGWIAVHE